MLVGLFSNFVFPMLMAKLINFAFYFLSLPVLVVGIFDGNRSNGQFNLISKRHFKKPQRMMLRFSNGFNFFYWQLFVHITLEQFSVNVIQRSKTSSSRILRPAENQRYDFGATDNHGSFAPVDTIPTNVCEVN